MTGRREVDVRCSMTHSGGIVPFRGRGATCIAAPTIPTSILKGQRSAPSALRSMDTRAYQPARNNPLTQNFRPVEHSLFPRHFCRRRPQRLWNRQAAGVRAPPPFKAPVNPPHSMGNVRWFGSPSSVLLPPTGRKTDLSKLAPPESRRLAERTLYQRLIDPAERSGG
jgi:hypothetical protein